MTWQLRMTSSAGRVLFRRDARTAGGVYIYRKLRHCSLYHEGVRDHTYVRAQTDELHGLQLRLVIQALKLRDKACASEGGLLVHTRAEALAQGLHLLAGSASPPCP